MYLQIKIEMNYIEWYLHEAKKIETENNFQELLVKYQKETKWNNTTGNCLKKRKSLFYSKI